MLTIICVISGVTMFALPANIFGTGLALKIQDQLKQPQQQMPAAMLMQNVWRYYASSKRAKLEIVWKRYLKGKPANSLSDIDRQSIHFIRLLKCLVVRKHFKLVIVHQNA